jgi:hypothetical protein
MAVVAVLAVVFGGPTVANASSILYGATGSGDGSGRLYVLNPADGSVVTDVGALRTAAGGLVALTALAFDPLTGILYGGTSNTSTTLRSHLVIVDPVTAIVTDIGEYTIPSTATDLAFAANGDLYGWEAAGAHRLLSVNPLTGVATPIGAGIGAQFGGGGLEFSGGGVLYVTPDGATAASPTLRSVNTGTGITANVANLTPNPFLGFSATINAMSWDPLTALMYGVFTTRSAGSLTHLVTINLATGALTDLGATPVDLDAIAFVAAVPEPATLALTGLGTAFVAFRRRRRSAT